MATGQQEVELVIFDVGGVLCADIVEQKLADLAARHGLPLQKLLQVKPALRRQADLGQIGEDEFWRRILAVVGHRVLPEDLLFEDYLVAIPGTQDLAVRLKRFRRVAILSNDTADMARVRRAKFGYDAVFDPIVISYRYGMAKPDVAIYRLTAELAGVEPGRCLMVDNTAENVDGARAAGMQAILFRNAVQLEEELRRRGLLGGAEYEPA